MLKIIKQYSLKIIAKIDCISNFILLYYFIYIYTVLVQNSNRNRFYV